MIGQMVRQLREKHGLSQEDLALAARISSGYLSKLERGLAQPSAAVLQRLAGALAVPLADLYTAAGLGHLLAAREPDSTPPWSYTSTRSTRCPSRTGPLSSASCKPSWLKNAPTPPPSPPHPTRNTRRPIIHAARSTRYALTTDHRPPTTRFTVGVGEKMDANTRDTIEFLIRRYRLHERVPVRLDGLLDRFTVRRYNFTPRTLGFAIVRPREIHIGINQNLSPAWQRKPKATRPATSSPTTPTASTPASASEWCREAHEHEAQLGAALLLVPLTAVRTYGDEFTAPGTRRPAPGAPSAW